MRKHYVMTESEFALKHCKILRTWWENKESREKRNGMIKRRRLFKYIPKIINVKWKIIYIKHITNSHSHSAFVILPHSSFHMNCQSSRFERRLSKWIWVFFLCPFIFFFFLLSPALPLYFFFFIFFIFSMHQMTKVTW